MRLSFVLRYFDETLGRNAGFVVEQAARGRDLTISVVEFRRILLYTLPSGQSTYSAKAL